MNNPNEENKEIEEVEKVAGQVDESLVSAEAVEKVEDINDADEIVDEIDLEDVGIEKAIAYAKKSEPLANSKDPKKTNQAIKEYGSSEMIEKVVSINRITKVTKGGKKLSFSALVVVGDTKGNVGYSLEKASEVATAIKKAMAVAKKNLIKVPMKGTTITHEIIGECSGARVLLKPAADGTGVIASGPVRAVCDGAGIHNILTKCHRSNNPINVVKATIDGLSRLKSKK